MVCMLFGNLSYLCLKNVRNMKRVICFFILVLCLTTSLSVKSQEVYYPEGTKWGFVICGNIEPPLYVYATNIDDFRTYESTVEGDTILYDVRRYLSTNEYIVLDSVRCKIIHERDYDYYHNLQGTMTFFFRETGDSIFYYQKEDQYYQEVFYYDFSPWHVGDVIQIAQAKNQLFEEDLGQMQLEDGNFYDCYGTCIRTIGCIFGGIIPWRTFGRMPRFIYITYFVRKGVVIYRNNNIIYPDGYETDVASLRREKGNGDSAVYSLQGVRLGNVGSLPPGIYIQNGKKIIKGKRTKDQSP